MRRSLFGVVLGTLLVLGLAVGQGFSEPPSAVQTSAVNNPVVSYQTVQPTGQPMVHPPSNQSTGNLITHVLSADGGPQALVVVDPGQRVMAVYHVDKATGEIALRSVRNITWDLQMVEFNSGEPLPQDIRNIRGELQR
jgi:hypothetical protein